MEKFRRRIHAPGYGGISVKSDIVRVNSVAGLEAALAAQKAKQTIEIESGVYQLTQVNDVIAAGSYGVLKGIGDVQIDGVVAGTKGCFNVDPAACGSTFKYTFENIRVRGYSALPGITIDNATVTKKMVLVFRNCSLGGTPAVNQLHTDATEAIRIYADGWRGDKKWQGAFNIAPGNADDIYAFKGIDMSAAGMAIGTGAVACHILWRNCIMKSTNGVTGGEATQITGAIGCFSYDSGVLASAAQTDFETNLDVIID